MRCLGRAVFLTDDLAVVVGAFAFTALRAVDRAAGLAPLCFFTAACDALRDFAFLAMGGLPCCYGERLAQNAKSQGGLALTYPPLPCAIFEAWGVTLTLTHPTAPPFNAAGIRRPPRATRPA